MRQVSRPVLLLLLVLLPALAPPAHAEPFTASRMLDQHMVANVMGAALAFMAPRTLEAVPLSDLTLWALRGLTTLDARLQPELSGGTLRLLAPGRVLLARAPPAPEDAAGWGQAVAELARAGWDASDAVRHAGQETLVHTLFDELFNHLDPYSRYAAPAEAQASRQRRAGRAGVGVQVVERGGGFVIEQVVPGGPAAQAGVRAGDRLSAIDGAPTQGADLASIDALLSGPDGTQVELRLAGRDGRVRVVLMTRATVVPQTVGFERVGDLLVIRLTGFAGDTGAQLAQAIASGMAGSKPPRGLVLDLRGNRGGLLLQAVAAAQVFLADGVVAATAGRDPQAAHVFRADGHDQSGGVPMVVLVDGRTASAAEILAAALADQHRAVVVGSATLGKGLVQTIAPLPDGGELLISWSRVLAPFGWPIQGLGVMPQVCTSLGEEQVARQFEALAHGSQPMLRALTRSRTARPPIPPAEILEIRNACPAAEGRDADLAAARRLIREPALYGAALIGPAPPPSGGAEHLTAGPAMRN